MTLEKLLEKTDHTIIRGDKSTEITDVIYDSRKVIPGCAFVCLVGSAVNGHKFAADAVAAGAAAVITSEDVDVSSSAAVVRVKDTREALAFMSAAFFGYPARELTTIGVTGTKGKTTTKTYSAKIASSADLIADNNFTSNQLDLILNTKTYSTDKLDTSTNYGLSQNDSLQSILAQSNK